MSKNPQLGFADHSIQHDLDDGARLERAKDIRGKILYIPPSDIAPLIGIDNDLCEETAKVLDKSIKTKNFKEVEEMIKGIKSTTPSYNEAESHTIARTMSKDLRHAISANEAGKEGDYIRVVHQDGSFDQGIVKYAADKHPMREGIWHRVDSRGTTVQVADFKDDQLHGENRFYDRNNQLTHRGYYQNGQAQDTHYDYADVNGKRSAVHRTHFDKGEFKGEEDVQVDQPKRTQARGQSH
jgi:antitoxin component YwqK of YwqJK toxin-antitoxin module